MIPVCSPARAGPRCPPNYHDAGTRSHSIGQCARLPTTTWTAYVRCVRIPTRHQQRCKARKSTPTGPVAPAARAHLACAVPHRAGRPAKTSSSTQTRRRPCHASRRKTPPSCSKSPTTQRVSTRAPRHGHAARPSEDLVDGGGSAGSRSVYLRAVLPHSQSWPLCFGVYTRALRHGDPANPVTLRSLRRCAAEFQ